MAGIEWFSFIQSNYNAGNYTAGQVWDFVSKSKITPEQFTIITGLEYGDRPADQAAAEAPAE